MHIKLIKGFENYKITSNGDVFGYYGKKLKRNMGD